MIRSYYPLKLFAQVTLFAGILLVLSACGSEPVSINDIEQTTEARATEAVATQEAFIDELQERIRSGAPADTVIAEELPGRDHQPELVIPFGELPPNGGPHHPNWQRCDIYELPVKPQHAVHALEHGAVWITYQTDLAADQVEELEDAASGEAFVLMSPYPNQRSPVVMTAWGLQLELDSAEDGRIEEFIRSYANGPQTPEPGASCRTGVTDTTETMDG